MKTLFDALIITLVIQSIVFAQNDYLVGLGQRSSLYIEYSELKNEKLLIAIDEPLKYVEIDHHSISEMTINKITNLFKNYSYKKINDEMSSFKYNITSKYFKEFDYLTKFPFNQELYISSPNGVYKGKIKYYYYTDLNNEQGFFYPLLKITDNNITDFDYRKIFVISNNKNIGIINCEDETNLNVVKNAKIIETDYKYIHKIKKSENFTQKETEYIIKGKFTAIKEQYFVCIIYHLDIDNIISYSFIMDNAGNKIIDVIEETNNDGVYKELVGTIDCDNDGLDEIIMRKNSGDGVIYYMYKYENSVIKLITSGLFFGMN